MARLQLRGSQAQVGRVRWRANHRDMARFLLSQRVQNIADSVAREAMTMAILNSPTSDDPRAPKYANSFSMGPVVVTLAGNPRRAARVRNDSPYAAQVEWGTDFGYVGQRRQGGSHGQGSRVFGKVVASFPGGKVRAVNKSTAIGGK